MTDETPVSAKPVKKNDTPAPAPEPVTVLSFEEFAVREDLDATASMGLLVHLRATTGLAPRPLEQWQVALNHFQVLA